MINSLNQSGRQGLPQLSSRQAIRPQNIDFPLIESRQQIPLIEHHQAKITKNLPLHA